MTALKTYTVQRDAFHNMIVCGDDETRYPFEIVFSGTYEDCLRYKVENTARPHTTKPVAPCRAHGAAYL